VSAPLPNRTRYLWLTAILALAAGLRLFALGWGLPDFHHPDEQYILNRALAFAKGDLNPKNFLYPTLYFYALFAWEGGFFVLGRIAGWYGSVAAFEREFFVDPTRLVVAGRALTALFGVATVAAVYRFGARLYNRWTGLGAALLLAVAPFAVRDAHYIKLDVPVALFVTLMHASLARIVVDPAAAARRGPWLAAGAFFGLAMSTQYYVFPAVLSIIAVAIMEARRTGRPAEAFRLLVWAGAASIAAFLAGSPFFLSDWSIVVRDMGAVYGIDVERSVEGMEGPAALMAYARMLATDATGWWMGAGAALVGMTVALRRDGRRGVLLTCFPVVYLLFLANTVPMTRYLNAMLPSLALAAAFAITHLVERWSTAPKKGTMVATALVCVALPGLVRSVRADLFYQQTDTRTQAREFIERTAPNGTAILVQPHSVQLAASRDALVDALRAHLGSETRASVKFQKQLEAASSLPHTYRVFYLGRVMDEDVAVDKFYVAPTAFDGSAGLGPLRDRQVTYVALNRYNVENPAFRSLNAALQREAHLVATFSPYREAVAPDRRIATAPFFHNTDDRIEPELERPGPTIDVWRID
jgi:hypothetical protein